jgi:hypothetical protein
MDILETSKYPGTDLAHIRVIASEFQKDKNCTGSKFAVKNVRVQ